MRNVRAKPRTSGSSEGLCPKGGARILGPRRVGARRVGVRRRGPQNFALFFLPLYRQDNSIFLVSSITQQIDWSRQQLQDCSLGQTSPGANQIWPNPTILGKIDQNSCLDVLGQILCLARPLPSLLPPLPRPHSLRPHFHTTPLPTTALPHDPTHQDRPKFSCFSLSRPQFACFIPSLGGLLVGPPGFHTTARELQTCTFEGAGASKTPPKFHEKTPREREKKSENGCGRGEKRSEILDGPAQWGSGGRNK